MQPSWRFALKGGIANPVGEFGMKSGGEDGLAEPGFVLGAQVSLYLGSGVSWTTSASFALNKVDDSRIIVPSGTTVEAGSWFTVWPMTGFRFEGRGSSSFSLNGMIQVGMMIGRSPELTVQQFDVVGVAAPATGSSIAFGIGIGCALNRTFLLEVSYLSASPEYDILISAEGLRQHKEQSKGQDCCCLCWVCSSEATKTSTRRPFVIDQTSRKDALILDCRSTSRPSTASAPHWLLDVGCSMFIWQPS